MDEITLDDKTYVSSKRAAQITGYAKDYVGQLCREGRVEARLVGRNWYVLESSIRDHRFGAPPTKESVKTESEPVHEWVPSNYTSEVVPELPVLAPATVVEAPVQVPPVVAPTEVPAVDLENTMHFGDKAGIHVFEENISSSGAAASVHDQESSEAKPDVVQEMQSAWHDWFSRTNELKVSEELLLENDPVALELPPEAPLIAEDDDNSSFDKVTTPIAIERVLDPEESESEVAEIEESAPVIASYTEDHDDFTERVPIKRSYRSESTAQVGSHSSPVSPAEGRIIRERRVSPAKRKRVSSELRSTKQQGRGLSVVFQVALIVIALGAIGVALIGTGKLDSFLTQSHVNYSPINYLVGQSSVEKAN